MAAILRPSTPPPTSEARTPQTPRWGIIHDDYQPYSPRKSARISERSSTITTATPKSSRSLSPTMTSAPASPPTAKKRVRASLPENTGRRISGALTMDSATTAASALGLSPPKDKNHGQSSAAIVRKNGMLPTPAKTPNKRPETISPAVTGVARNLFAIRPGSDEIMPSPKKSRKRQTNFSLGGLEDEESAPIHIYTDSQDRVPEVDAHADNPFYGKNIVVPNEPNKQSTRRQGTVHIDGEGEVDIEKLTDRKDGMLYTFRGKKVFRKFETDIEDDPEQTSSDTEVMDKSTSPARRGPLTRSSVKPRRLFPSSESAQTKSHNTEDEEADTDIEEADAVSTPTSQVFDKTATPKAPRFGAFTPPTTVRATRSKKLDMGDNSAASDDDMGVMASPVGQRHGTAKDNPFAEWSRARAIPKESKKRSNDSSSGGAVKKARA